MQLHCPECGSTNLTPITETTNEGGFAVNNRMSKNSSFSNIVMNSTHRNYWMCASCGEKFRNIKNLQQEIIAVQKKLRMYYILGAMILFIFVGALVLDALPAFLPIILILGAITLIYILVNKKHISDMTNELHYLKKKCFD